MSVNEPDINKIIDALDEGDDSMASKELTSDYRAIVKAIDHIGEEKLKEELDRIHSAMDNGTFFGRNVYWISGIAASFVGAFFWWQTMNPKMSQPILQMNEVPIYSDSATYDSLKVKPNDVDKSSK